MREEAFQHRSVSSRFGWLGSLKEVQKPLLPLPAAPSDGSHDANSPAHCRTRERAGSALRHWPVGRRACELASSGGGGIGRYTVHVPAVALHTSKHHHHHHHHDVVNRARRRALLVLREVRRQPAHGVGGWRVSWGWLPLWPVRTPVRQCTLPLYNVHNLVGTKTWGSMTGRVVDQGLTVDSGGETICSTRTGDRFSLP